MITKTFSHGKRAFWLFCLLSVNLWLIAFLIRILFVDNEYFIPPETSELQVFDNFFKVAQQLDEGNKFNAFSSIFWNNLKICLFNIAGGAMFGIATIISLLQNGFFTADVFCILYNNGISVNEILKHTLPHSVELIASWLSGAIGFCFAKLIIDYLREKALPNDRFIVFMGFNSLIIVITTLIAALIEVYISVPI